MRAPRGFAISMTSTGNKYSCVNLQQLNPAWQFLGWLFIINYSHYLSRTGEFYVKAEAQLEHNAAWGAAHRQRNTRDQHPCLSPPPPRAGVEKGGRDRYRWEAEGGAGLAEHFML